MTENEKTLYLFSPKVMQLFLEISGGVHGFFFVNFDYCLAS